MPLTRTNTLRLIKIGAGALIILLIAGYALSRSLNYARGPHITVLEPEHGAAILASTTLVRGQVERANNITLNGKALLIDEEGHFSETIIVFTGVNVITLEASDQFERSVEMRIEVVGDK